MKFAIRRKLLAAGLVTSLIVPVLAQADRPSDMKYQWKGQGNVVFTRCLGMVRGPDCLTHQDRKKAAERVKARLDNAVPQTPKQTNLSTNNPE